MKTVSLLLALALVVFTATNAFALGSDFTKEQIAAAGSHCVHGFWVNEQSVVFYAGDTVLLNRDLSRFLEGQYATRRVVIHVGTKQAESPWDTKPRDIFADWCVNTWDDQADAEKAVPRMKMQIDIWLGSKIKLDDLRIPKEFEVVSGGEIDQFIQKQKQEQPTPPPVKSEPHSFHDFDQAPGKGWRAFADQKQYTEAARMIEGFLAKQAQLTAREKANLHFHAAQCLAIEGSALSIADALVHLKDSRSNPEPPESSTPWKDHVAAIKASQQWNDYVEATEVFLKGDLPALKAARERIAAGPKMDGEIANLDVVDRLIVNFGKSYAEAYLTDAGIDKESAFHPTPAPTDVVAAREGLLKPGTQSPELPYMCLDDGRMTSLAARHHGKIVVLTFWTTWSGPSHHSMSEIQKTAATFAEHKDKIDFLTISIDSNAEDHVFKMTAVIDKAVSHLKKSNWTHTMNGWCPIEELKEWKLRAVPTTYIIDTDGKIIIANPEKKLEDVITPLLMNVSLNKTATRKKHKSEFGRKLYSGVTRVHFSGPCMPANSDGKLGGIVAEANGSTITIYKRVIVRVDMADDKTIYRTTVYPYDTLGEFELRSSP